MAYTCGLHIFIAPHINFVAHKINNNRDYVWFYSHKLTRSHRKFVFFSVNSPLPMMWRIFHLLPTGDAINTIFVISSPPSQNKGPLVRKPSSPSFFLPLPRLFRVSHTPALVKTNCNSLQLFISVRCAAGQPAGQILLHAQQWQVLLYFGWKNERFWYRATTTN